MASEYFYILFDFFFTAHKNCLFNLISDVHVVTLKLNFQFFFLFPAS